MNQYSFVTYLLLCFFLGGLGVHKFYVHDKHAVLYLVFFWTLIPAILALIDFIRALVEGEQIFNRKYNNA